MFIDPFVGIIFPCWYPMSFTSKVFQLRDRPVLCLFGLSPYSIDFASFIQYLDWSYFIYLYSIGNEKSRVLGSGFLTRSSYIFLKSVSNSFRFIIVSGTFL